MITKQHFIRAAEIVAAIRAGEWTDELPAWAPVLPWSGNSSIEIITDEHGNLNVSHIRAVWTAEAFIHLFREWNPRFNQHRFLVGCGLVEKPAKKGWSKTS